MMCKIALLDIVSVIVIKEWAVISLHLCVTQLSSGDSFAFAFAFNPVHFWSFQSQIVHDWSEIWWKIANQPHTTHCASDAVSCV